MVKRILYYPDPVLTRKAEEVDPRREGLSTLVEEMFEAMEEARGVGLAAPQVGEGIRLFVANVGADPDAAVICVNPRLETSGPLVELEEGCLSLPGINAMILRPERAKVTAFDLSGEEFVLEADGLLARILQHELDHLEGILFFDRMSPGDRLRVRDDLKAFEEQYRPR